MRQGEQHCPSGRARCWRVAGRSEDGADVISAPAAELRGSFHRRDEGSVAMNRLQVRDLADLAGQLRYPGRGCSGQERRRSRAESQKLLLGGARPGCE